MVGEGDVAVDAMGDGAAVLAGDPRGKAPAVLEEDGLLPFLQYLLKCQNQRLGEVACGEFLFLLLPHVDDLDLWEDGLHCTLVHFHQGIPAFLGIVVGLEGWGGGTQEDVAIQEAGCINGHVTGMVAGAGFVLLKGLVVFFVDDDEAEVFEGKEDGGADSNHDLVFSQKDFLPDLHPLLIVKTAVVNAHLLAQFALDLVDDLLGDGDLGQEVKDLLPSCQGFADEFDVKVGLAAACDAVQQDGTAFLLGKGGLDPAQCNGLFV